jgi:hypothetical protein
MTNDNLPNLSIRVMREADLSFAAECTAAKGWVSENMTTLVCVKWRPLHIEVAIFILSRPWRRRMRLMEWSA